MTGKLKLNRYNLLVMPFPLYSTKKVQYNLENTSFWENNSWSWTPETVVETYQEVLNHLLLDVTRLNVEAIALDGKEKETKLKESERLMETIEKFKILMPVVKHCY